MSTVVVVLFVVGLMLLGVEVIVPGAILGLAGVLLLLAGVIVAFVEHGSSGGMLAAAIAVVSVLLLMFLEFVVLPRTRFGKRMFLDRAIDAKSQAPVVERASDVIGRSALACTALAPSGVVEIDGRRYEARCESGFAAEGEHLRVVRVETFQLVVTQSS
jgi:membrane-bound serine protease (ClpP class)